jgi:hypothetical protein
VDRLGLRIPVVVTIALFALIALCSSAPIANQNTELQDRFDIYNDLLANLFSGLVQTTTSTLSNFLNQLITENPLNVGKRDVQSDLAARVDALSFLYDNILQQFFSGLVSNTFGTISNTLLNLIQQNPLNVGKRDVQGDLAARVDALSFLYDNILQQLFSGLVSNTFNTISNGLLNLIQENPLGIGKRDVQSDLAARVDALSFLYDNILQQLFSGIVSNTFGTISNTLLNLIQENPLGVGKRALDFNANVFAELFNGLAANAAQFLQNALNDIFSKPYANLRFEVINLEQAKTVIAGAVSTLIETFKKFAQEAIAALNDRQKLSEVVKANIAHVKTIVTQLAEQLSQIIPSTIINEVSEVLASLQSTLIFWASGLGGSLGPVIGPFRP